MLTAFLMLAVSDVRAQDGRKDSSQTPAPAPAIEEPAIEGGRPETVKVLGISVRGLTTIQEKEVLSRLLIREGDDITIPGNELGNAVKRLWKQKLFSDIKIRIERKTIDGVFLAVDVIEYPLLENINYEGNSQLSTDDLKGKSALVRGTTATEQALESAKFRMKKYYEEEGFLLAEITYELRESDGNKATAFFFIKENSRVFIEKIRFHGNTAYDNGTLEGVLEETKANSFLKNIFGRPKLDRKKFDEDKQKLADYYRDNGFRDARVLSDTITYSEDKTKLYLDIYVKEGPKYTIRNIVWEGNSLYTTEQLESVFGFKKGDSYNQKRLQERLNGYTQQDDNVSGVYMNRGYLGFRTDLEETPAPNDSIDLKIFVTEGNQFTIRSVNVKGNTKTKDHVIRRELFATRPGDLFSRENVLRSLRQLQQLQYFNPEKLVPDVQPVTQGGKDEVDITFTVEEKQTDSFNASAGYAGTFGFTGAFGVTFKNFSLQDVFNPDGWDPLPHGDGQTLGFDWQFGVNSAFRTLSVSFAEPWAFGTPTSLGVNIFDTYQNYGTEIRQTGISTSIGRRLSWPDDFFRIDWTVRYQRNTGGLFINGSGASNGNAPDVADEVSLIQTISRNSVDNPIFPRAGSDLSLSLQLSGGVLPGTVDFYKFQFSNAWYKSLYKDLTLLVSSRFGYLGKFNESDYTPYINYFYMGGSGLSPLPTVQLRGYEDRTIGVFDPSINLYTGNVYTKFNAELRYPITLNPTAGVWVCAFAEAGNNVIG
ncbi:MAG: outer membrane protein assembly factor BamA [Rhizobacter sp.]|nr:outer membrane protein assembly factor BamA [Chlorobiales bacterium]